MAPDSWIARCFTSPAGNGGHGCASCTGRSSSRWGSGRWATAATAATSSRRRPRVCTPCWTSISVPTPRPATAGRRQGGTVNGADGDGLELRCPRHRRARRGRDRAGRPGRRRHPASLRPAAVVAGSATPHCVAGPQGPRLRAAGRAGRARRRGAGIQVGRRRRTGRLPLGRQVVADLGAVGGPAEDRRLPVHHAGAQPRGGDAPGTPCSPWPTFPV